MHNIRVAFGNGLRSDIWMEFQRRFKIPKIIEFFGATEAPTFFINICDKVGAVGRISPLIVRYQFIQDIELNKNALCRISHYEYYICLVLKANPLKQRLCISYWLKNCILLNIHVELKQSHWSLCIVKLNSFMLGLSLQHGLLPEQQILTINGLGILYAIVGQYSDIVCCRRSANGSEILNCTFLQ